MRRAFVVSLIALGASTAAIAADNTDHGAHVYQRCAACHLPNGKGVPGAFPALAGRLAGAASTDGGRDYLVMAVTAGLMGEIDVDGKKIRGVMPAQAGLADADIAAVLNYAVALKGGEDAPAQKIARAFTPEEVAAIRARFPNPNPNAVHAIRGGAFPPPDGAVEK